ncbi:MAG: AhpC/TSA family protein [Chloroflexi bacterium]|nr:AhpC/TSA family protein [Chloroflexota bacterium]
MKFKRGDIVPATTLESVTGEPIKLPDPDRLVHLQFRRFVDCPICNTHISQLRVRADEIEAVGVKEVIVFHSSAKSIRSYQKDVPFELVGDPTKALYKKYGVETSPGFLSPRALGAAARGVAHGHFGLRLSGGPFGLPGDFLIAPSGQITAVKYGTHAYDQWSVDELIALARVPPRCRPAGFRRSRRSSPPGLAFGFVRGARPEAPAAVTLASHG